MSISQIYAFKKFTDFYSQYGSDDNLTEPFIPNISEKFLIEV